MLPQLCLPECTLQGLLPQLCTQGPPEVGLPQGSPSRGTCPHTHCAGGGTPGGGPLPGQHPASSGCRVASGVGGAEPCWPRGGGPARDGPSKALSLLVTQTLRSAALDDCALCQETLSSSDLAAKTRDGDLEGAWGALVQELMLCRLSTVRRDLSGCFCLCPGPQTQ